MTFCFSHSQKQKAQAKAKTKLYSELKNKRHPQKKVWQCILGLVQNNLQEAGQLLRDTFHAFCSQDPSEKCHAIPFKDVSTAFHEHSRNFRRSPQSWASRFAAALVRNQPTSQIKELTGFNHKYLRQLDKTKPPAILESPPQISNDNPLATTETANIPLNILFEDPTKTNLRPTSNDESIIAARAEQQQ